MPLKICSEHLWSLRKEVAGRGLCRPIPRSKNSTRSSSLAVGHDVGQEGGGRRRGPNELYVDKAGVSCEQERERCSESISDCR